MLQHNLLLSTDSYKGSHSVQLPPDAEASRFYAAPRKPLTPKSKDWILFGLTYFVGKYLRNPLTPQHLAEALPIWNAHGIGGKPYPFPKAAIEYILDKYQGYLPITIKGLREGMPFDKYNVPAVLVECHDPKLVWLPGFIETALQRNIWYASTVANLSREVRKYLKKIYDENVDLEMHWTLDSRLHDFGARGATSEEAAGLGGLAHLINFNGTDTIEALVLGHTMYNMAIADLAASIPAAEHSTETSWGPDQAAERTALLNMIEQFGNEPLFAFVSDSYDFKSLVDNVWGDPLIMAKIREKGVMPVVRPDSGDPEEMVLYALNSLANTWGAAPNKKGKMVLNGIRIIQGDGMEYKTIVKLYDRIIAAGYSPENLAIGMGGGLLQKVNRDDMSWSMKMFQIKRDGLWYNVQKKPKTQTNKTGWDPSMGLNQNDYVTYYENGKVNEDMFDFKLIRERARA